MNKFFISFLFLTNIVFAQLPDTDIFLCRINSKEGTYNFSKPENITNRKGYDNQPCFTPDGKKILFVSIFDSTQSDIYSYDIKSRQIKQVTKTPVSEYSPAYTPDNKFISVVRVDADSGQRFYKLPFNSIENPVLLKNTDSIGYAGWINDSMLTMFILGPAHTLQLLNINTSERRLIASDIGRCMKLSSDKSKMYFVLKSNEKEWFIYSLDCKDFSLSRITQTLPNNEDFAIMPDGTFFMGMESKLYRLDPLKGWIEIADFSSSLPGFYRISINENGTMLALVAFTGKKP